jgi:hypothetical protein
MNWSAGLWKSDAPAWQAACGAKPGHQIAQGPEAAWHRSPIGGRLALRQPQFAPRTTSGDHLAVLAGRSLLAKSERQASAYPHLHMPFRISDPDMRNATGAARSKPCPDAAG